MPDACDIEADSTLDCNDNGTLDECETIAPQILAGPASQAVGEGEAVTLEVIALTAGKADYQWRKNGRDLEGATESA